MPAAYSKPFLTVSQQIALLQARGLDVGPQADAEALLTQFGYYRLSGYWHPLRHSIWDVNTGKIVYSNDFQPSATLAQAISLAEFDRRLRSLFAEAIERIEVGIRVRVALLFGARDPAAHRNSGLLYPRFTHQVDKKGSIPFQRWLRRLDDNEARSKEQFAVHFREKYGPGPFPLWVSIEVWDFGMLSQFIGGMTIADQMALSTPFGVSRIHVFPSWLRAINHIRNICAHHSRLWNRSPSDQPVPPKTGEHALLDHLAVDAFAHVRLYAAAAIIQFVLRQIDPPFTAQWAPRLKAQFDTFPAVPGVVAEASGFPLNWGTQALWN